MKHRFSNVKKTRTSFIQLDTEKCKACWKCIANCPNHVISKVDLPWHRHAILKKSDHCTGCLQCMNVCEFGAFSITDNINKNEGKQRARINNKFVINILLLITGLIMTLSGYALQFGFHMHDGGNHHSESNNELIQSVTYVQSRGINPVKTVWGFHYSEWSKIHKISIVLISLLMIYHFYNHWKWYKGVIRKKLVSKNIQVFTLSALFTVVAVTGLIPWFIDLSGSANDLRYVFIEIHDKLTLIFTVYLILHIIKRKKWYIINRPQGQMPDQ